MGDYFDQRDTADERDAADPRYCPPNSVRIWWPGGYRVADPATVAELRRHIRQVDQLETELATVYASLLVVGIAARNYLACYPDGKRHGRDGRRAAEALLTALKEAGL